MKSDKHETKKQEIIDSAFRIWGGCRYINTSLSDLASAHQLTKQALYRYFPSKEKIEQAMEERALDLYNSHSNELLDRLSGISGDEFVDTYTEKSIEFISRYGSYLGFLAYRYRQHSNGPEIAREHMKAFGEIALKNAGIPEIGLRYLNSITFMMVHHKKSKDKPAIDWRKIWNHGFGSELIINQPDFDRLLSDASMVNYGVFAEDPIMRAVFETVMEEAGNGISLGKVAKKAGLTKSSLYNYWPGKEAMLADVLGRQTALFGGLFETFATKYSRPEDRFFAYLAFTGTFLRRTPEILNYLQRVMSYGVQMPQDKTMIEESFIRPMKSVLESGLLNLNGYEPSELLGLVNLAGVNEIKHHLTEESARIRIEQGLKDLYLLIMGGISALRRTM
jgi:AcrR family transcriptional regulator